MKKVLLGMAATALVSLFGSAASRGEDNPPKPLDVVLVLDNSGSMKTNDPEFLIREVVSNFVQRLSESARVALEIYADRPDLRIPLTALSQADAKKRILDALTKVDYTGQYTNTPAAVERAIYELKQNGRADAERIVILMTDGLIDTGDRARDMQRRRWLEEDLAQESRNAGIRVFGIAFTDEADFELMQTLGQKTGGGYYRAAKSQEVQSVFNEIQQAMLKPPARPETSTLPVEMPAPERGLTSQFLIVGLVGLIVLAIIVVYLKRPSRVESRAPALPVPARLSDRSGVTGQSAFVISRNLTSIGREAPPAGKQEREAGQFLCIPKSTVSALHASIEYRDRDFFLTDHGSTNGTTVNGERLAAENPRILTAGDVIGFAEYAFEFVLPGRPARGGTVLSPGVAAGGTVLSSGASPREPDLESRKAAAAAPAGDDESTRLKQAYCERHPSVKNTEICPVCKNACCSLCLQEQDGKKLCVTCRERQAHAGG